MDNEKEIKNNEFEIEQKIRENIENFVKEKKYNETLDYLELLLKSEPNNYKLLCNKAHILGITEKYSEANQVIEKALKLDRDEHILFEQGLNYYYLNHYKEAIKAFDESLKIRPNNVRVILKKLSALEMADMYDDAIKLFESSDLPEPENYIFYNNIGYTYMKVEKFKRAEEYLLKAKAMNKNSGGDKDNLVYGNLLLLYSTQKRFFKYLLCYAERFYALLIRKKIINLGVVQAPINKYRGPGTLFTQNSQYREIQAIFKTFRTPFFWALCSEWFNWFAINIPLNLLGDKGYKGDIDLLISMPRDLPPNEKTLSRYRAFEVKSILMDKHGRVKSLNQGKRNREKIYSQLKKYKKFGCEQIFLLELYIAERGYSDKNNFPPKEVIVEASEKIKKFNNEFGYVMMIHEPSPYINDESGGLARIPINVLPAKDNIVKFPFSDLVNFIDNFYHKEVKYHPRTFTVVSYCKRCKKLIMLYTDDKELKCPDCKKEIYK